jgi:hypothetical protein
LVVYVAAKSMGTHCKIGCTYGCHLSRKSVFRTIKMFTLLVKMFRTEKHRPYLIKKVKDFITLKAHYICGAELSPLESLD